MQWLERFHAPPCCVLKAGHPAFENSLNSEAGEGVEERGGVAEQAEEVVVAGLPGAGRRAVVEGVQLGKIIVYLPRIVVSQRKIIVCFPLPVVWLRKISVCFLPAVRFEAGTSAIEALCGLVSSCSGGRKGRACGRGFPRPMVAAWI